MVEPYVSQMRLGLELAASEINAMGGLAVVTKQVVHGEPAIGGLPARAVCGRCTL